LFSDVHKDPFLSLRRYWELNAWLKSIDLQAETLFSKLQSLILKRILLPISNTHKSKHKPKQHLIVVNGHLAWHSNSISSSLENHQDPRQTLNWAFTSWQETAARIDLRYKILLAIWRSSFRAWELLLLHAVRVSLRRRNCIWNRHSRW